MARSLFGGSSDDYAVDSNGRPVAGRRVRFYTSAAMSTEITDLASDAAGTGSPLTVTTDSRGYWGPVYGPDAVTVMYAGTVDAAGNPPAYVVAVYTHTQTGGGGGAGVSSFNTRTGAVSLSKADVTGTGLAAADVAADASGAASTAQTAAQTYADTADVLRAKPRGAWVTAMAYAVNDVVTSGGAAYRCLVAHTSGASFSGAGTNWEAWGSAASPLTDRGAWTTTTAYAVNDVVTQGGNRYVCKVAHTSGTFATDLGAGDWTLTGASTGGAVADRGTWAATTAYAVGDLVNQGGYRYQATAAHTSSAAFATDKATKWAATGVAVDTTSAPSGGQWPVYLSSSGLFKVSAQKYFPGFDVYGDLDAGLKFTRAAIQRVRLGTGDFRYNNYGDSISVATVNQFTPKATQFAATRLGITSQRVKILNRDVGTPPEITAGTGWATTNTGGLNGWFSSAGNANTIDVTPTVNCDSFVVYTFANQGNVQYAVDAGGYTTYTNNVGSGVVAFTVSAGSVGSHTLHLKAAATGSSCYVLGVEAVDSTARGFRWRTVGNSGQTTSQALSDTWWMGTNSDYLTSVKAAGCDLFTICLGVNDYTGGVGSQIPSATTQSNLNTIVSHIRSTVGSTCDIALVVWPPNGTATGSITGYAEPEANYWTALENVADTSGIIVIHTDRRFVSYATANASPISFMQDTTHPNNAGNADMGAMIANVICAGG